MAEPLIAVTPAGIRSGDRATSEALCARRGSAVIGYCQHVAAPGEAVSAAAESFARFRAAVITTPDSNGVDPDVLLLSATRHAAARHAPRPALAQVVARLGGHRRGPQTCALVPELLAARAEDALSDADRLRLSRHLQGCRTCEAAQQRFSAGEAAFHSPSEVAPDPVTSAAIVSALSPAAKAPPPPVDPGPDFPDDSQVVTAARITSAAAVPVAVGGAATGALAPPDQPPPPMDSGGPGTAVPTDDGFGEEVAALQSSLDVAPDELEPDAAEYSDTGEHGPGRLPPAPIDHFEAAEAIDDPDVVPFAAGTVLSEPVTQHRRPLWVLVTPVIVLLALVFLGLALAGAFGHSGGRGAAHPTTPPAAVRPAAAVPAVTAGHHAVRHHHRHHHRPTAGSASGAAASDTSSSASAGTAAGSSTPTPAAPSTPAAKPSTPAATPSPAATAPTPAVTPAPAPAQSVQSGGSSVAAPPASGGAPATGAPTTFQPSS